MTNSAITPVALLRTPTGHLMKARLGEKVIRFPLELLHRANTPRGLRDFLAERYGIVVEDVGASFLRQAASNLPRIHGTPRLGWTPDYDAFLYGRDVLYTAKCPVSRYEFTGTRLLPGGAWDRQFEGLVELWARVPLARLILSLSTMSPFLEPLAAPSHVLHVVGPSGIGKTTLISCCGHRSLRQSSL